MLDFICLCPCVAPQPTFLNEDVLAVWIPLAALGLSALTFWLGYHQKERQRTLTYYHKIVTEPLVPEIIAFCAKNELLIQEAAQISLAAFKGNRKSIPREATQKLTNFSTELFELQDKIVEKIEVFDSKSTRKLEGLFELFQDRITDWFNQVALRRRRNPEELQNIFLDRKRAIVKLLYRGQFRNFHSFIFWLRDR